MTCVILMPDIERNSSADNPLDDPEPVLANRTGSDCAFAQVMNSATVVAGTSLLMTMILGGVLRWTTGTMSFTGS